MKQGYYLLLFTFIELLIAKPLFAQNLHRDFLITTPMYCDTFSYVGKANDKVIYDYLMIRNLNQWVADTIINTNDMQGFALPLGVFKNNLNVDFSKGMIDMWRAKAFFIKSQSDNCNIHIFITALNAIEANTQAVNKMTLLQYRNNLITPAIETVSGFHKELKPLYSPERAIFMSIIMENITPDIILGFNIQEMLPPAHMLVNRRILNINPLFKACYLDKLLQEAGVEFLHYFPSRYDQILSYGPFQLTSIALEDVHVNNRLSSVFKIFNSFNDLRTIDDHILATVIFAYNNWERLSFLIQADGTIQKFNSYFSDYSTDKDKTRKLKIFITGMTACMHHHPPNTFQMLRSFLKETDDLTQIHIHCIEERASPQLKKYYRSSVEATLMLQDGYFGM
jgi:hypothetical protein